MGMSIFRVVLIDDNTDDISLLKEAFAEWSRLTVDFSEFQNGKDALDFLGSGLNQEMKPDIIIIDLKLPGLSGFQTLEAVKGLSGFGKVPVAVLTTSNSEDDMRESLSWGADIFLSKPSGWSGYRDLVKTIETYKNTS